jgi:hypothetical protein
MSDQVKYPDCTVQLTGKDGNAFYVMGRVREALRCHLKEQGLSREEVDSEVAAYIKEATSGDYNHLLSTTMQWVEVQ